MLEVQYVYMHVSFEPFNLESTWTFDVRIVNATPQWVRSNREDSTD